GGNGGSGRTNSGDGNDGAQPGGGGGGAFRTSGTKNGGDGGDGRVTVTWFIPEINIQGNATTINDGDLVPNTTDGTDFGTIDLSVTVTNTFTIHNLGTTGTLTIGAITFTGANPTNFSVIAAPAANVSPGSSTTFTVRFTPSAVGTRTATINIASNDYDESSYTFSLQGIATHSEINVQGNGADIVDGDITPVTTDWTDFGTASVTSGTIVRTFTIQNKNTATTPLSVGAISISGTNASDFTVTALPAASVAINSSTTFQVTFNPGAMGLRTASISIANNDGNESPYNFSIQGTGTDAEIDVQGNAISITDGDATPTTADWTGFGTTDVASGTIARTFTIENEGNLTLTISTPVISGTNAADFSLTASPATSLAAGATTTFTVTFNPSALGARNAAISIANNDSDENPYNFSIQGTGGDPEINLQGNGVTIADNDMTPGFGDFTDFGSTYISGGTINRTYTIQNTGSATGPLNIGAITFTGANPGDFSVTTAPASSVSISSSTTFVVTFNPGAIGLRSAIVNIVNNDNGENPYNFAIQGTGTDPEINLVGNGANIANNDMLPTTADWTDFGLTNITSGTIPKTFTIQNKNTGTATLNIIGSIVISGTNAADFTVTTAPASTVTVNSSTTFIVTFNPSALGLRTAIVTIDDNDSDEDPYVFAIQGTGITPEMDVQGNSVSIVDGDITPSATDNTIFGSADIYSATITKTFFIYNDATATQSLTIGAITFSGTNAADFTVTTPPAATVAAGASTSFVVTFNPGGIGTRTAAISIVNNDDNENPYGFDLSGTGTDPEINVQGNATNIATGDATPSTTDWTDFGATDITSGTIAKTFTIFNVAGSTATLNIGAITFSGTNASDFTVTASPAASIITGASTTFTVTFNPSGTGNRTATISIANNDSNESPYTFALTGVGLNPEINVLGNGVSIADGDITPSIADLTDLGSVSVDSGSTVVTFTIQNTASGANTLNIGAITFSGPSAGDFTVITYPAATVAAGGSTTFIISFNPTVAGIKLATISIASDDADESPYNFDLGGVGVRTYADTDGDGISDNVDIDDDNDGVLDTLEQTNCVTYPLAGAVEYTFLNETFGTGTTKGLININIPGATCTYCYEDGIVGPNTTACPSQSSWILDDGEYVVTYKIAGTTSSDPENIHGDLAWNGLVDHTVGDTNGRMAVFNASFTAGTFYETTVSGIMPNVPITYSFWAMNIMSQSNFPSSILPNITVQFLTTSGTVLSTFNTGDIGRCTGSTTLNTCAYSEWQQYTTSVNLGSNTAFIIRFKNNAPGGGGNDLALDDITIKQEYCDRDADGVANIFDLDSDNDGIPDIEEAGFKSLSGGRGVMDLATSGVWVDTNHNGLHDTIDARIAAGTYVLPDTDGDGISNIVDLDSDNDSIFDVDESGLLNGDGDIDGDGFGDGLDADADGFLNLYDTYTGQGTAVRPFAGDTDGNGTPDYMQLDSNSDGVKDIVGTLYNAWDANNDGKIDGSTDIDKDGIIDAWDTDTAVLGSPRDLNRKLFLDFDGRNDYGEATQMLSGLSKSTIMGWIKLTSPYTATGYVIGQDDFNLKVDTSSGTKLIATANGVTVTYATNLTADRWYHIAAVYDGTASNDKLKLYVNGYPINASGSTSIAATLAASTAKFTFGKNAIASSDYFKGSIDEVRVFNSALTDDQLQKMVYQEIKQNGTFIRGEIVPKDIELSAWANLLGYYRMDAYKDDVIDSYTTAAIDAGSSTSLARIYNVKNIKYQLAPMPFVTTQSGALDLAVSQNNFVYGNDVLTNDWTIVQVKHDINLNTNLNSIGLFLDAGKNLILNNDNAVKNSWYVKLDGKMDLQGKSQFVQGASSDLDVTSSGYIERDQQGTVNKWNYNYWSSPVGAINTTSNNNAYTVASVFKDGTNPANPQNITWTAGLDGTPTSPVTLSSYWIFKFQNLTNAYANWASVGPTGSLIAGQGFTLKGSGAASATQNYVFVGKPNNANVTSPIAGSNMNLSGNPYASAIDANQFINDNLTALDGTVYFWEHFSTNHTHVLADYQGGYATYTLVGGTPPVSPSGISGLGSSSRTPKRFIPVGQGFFINANATGGTIKFNNGQRAFVKEDNVTSNVMFRNGNQTASLNGVPNNDEDIFETDTYGKIRLGFNSNNNYHRQILLGFMDDKATAAIDKGYDAYSMDDQPNDMYFLKQEGAQMNILGESYFNNNDIFPLGVKCAGAGTVSFTLDGTENFDAGQEMYIYDAITGLYHDIRNEMFSIELPNGIVNDRFSLRFTNTSLSVGEVTLEDGIVVAYTNANSILNIKNNVIDVTAEDVSLFNMLGQSVARWAVSDLDQHNIQLPVKNLSIGTYIVKIHTTKGDISKKIAIK
ncbi:MAG TPA: choice-of-anchor D domain-containing protein, partial [Flavobacterium sp.]|nr:choice-of-anchor D domain-containing protein [Flavobacterium sp.]